MNYHPSTPINVQCLAAQLCNHPDSMFVDHLLSQGFWVGVITLPTVTYVTKNLQSAAKEPNIVSQLLEREVSNIIGMLLVHFTALLSPCFAQAQSV